MEAHEMESTRILIHLARKAARDSRRELVHIRAQIASARQTADQSRVAAVKMRHALLPSSEKAERAYAWCRKPTERTEPQRRSARIGLGGARFTPAGTA